MFDRSVFWGLLLDTQVLNCLTQVGLKSLLGPSAYHLLHTTFSIPSTPRAQRPPSGHLFPKLLLLEIKPNKPARCVVGAEI
jgi:hypothetical protein